MFSDDKTSVLSDIPNDDDLKPNQLCSVMFKNNLKYLQLILASNDNNYLNY